jgi:hypothetical protein
MDFDLPLNEERDERWDELFSFNVTEATGDNRILGAVFVGDQFFVSGGNNGGDVNRIYRFNRDGQLVGQFDQPCRDLWGMHDLAWDGERLYGGCGRWIYSMNLQGGDVDSIRSPLIPPRGLAVDPETGNIWVVNGEDPLYQLDAEGNVIRTFPHRLRPYGLAWRGDDPDGCPLYIFSADGETNLAVSKFSPVEERFRLEAEFEQDPDDLAGGCELTTGWNGAHCVLVCVIQNPEGDRVALFDAGLNRAWISVDPVEGVVESDGELECAVHIATAGLTGGNYAVELVISHNAVDGEFRLPITMVYEAQWAVVPEQQPSAYQLEAVYPNPTNGMAAVSFRLPYPGRVIITLFDQTGRQVDTLTDGRFSSGYNSISFTTNDLPSGIYFITMHVEERFQTRKFVLLK